MNCLDCATMLAAAPMARTAVGCCTYCGAGICLDHARFLMPYGRPIGVVPPQGGRRVVCTSCDAAAGSRGETADGRANGHRQAYRRGPALLTLGWPGWLRRRRSRTFPRSPSAGLPATATWPEKPPRAG